MLERLERRGERLARERAEARRARIARRLQAAAPGVAVTSDGEAVAMAGRGLRRRYDRSAALRWAIQEACDER